MHYLFYLNVLFIRYLNSGLKIITIWGLTELAITKYITEYS